MAARKRKPAKRKPAKRKSTRTSKSKKRGGQIPLKVLERRLARLAAVVERRRKRR